MKKVSIASADKVKVTSFVLNEFLQHKKRNDSVQQVSRKELKYLAKKIGLHYSDEEIRSIKKLLKAYLAKRVEER